MNFQKFREQIIMEAAESMAETGRPRIHFEKFYIRVLHDLFRLKVIKGGAELPLIKLAEMDGARATLTFNTDLEPLAWLYALEKLAENTSIDGISLDAGAEKIDADARNAGTCAGDGGAETEPIPGLLKYDKELVQKVMAALPRIDGIKYDIVPCNSGYVIRVIQTELGALARNREILTGLGFHFDREKSYWWRQLINRGEVQTKNGEWLRSAKAES